jgi:hypothetical protein
MPSNNDRAMDALRITYNAAVTAHAGCTRALTAVALRGEQAPSDMLEAEAKARIHLTEARARLHSAMARAMAGKRSS